MRLLPPLLAATLSLGACAFDPTIVPVGPGTYALGAMRAPVRGGGPEARRVVLAAADAFCARQGGRTTLLDLSPAGDPATPYWPTAFNATFRCAAPPSR